MILKGFYRKSTTKNFFAILVLIFTFFAVLIFANKEYVSNINKQYKNSALILENIEEKEYKKIMNISGIAKTMEGIIGVIDNRTVMIKMEDSEDIKNDSFIVPDTLEEIIGQNDDYSIIIGNQTVKLSAQGYYIQDISGEYIIKVNKNTYQKLAKIVNDRVYILFIDNWLAKDSITKKIKSNISVEPIIFEHCEGNNCNFDNVILMFKIFKTLALVIFVIIFVLSVVNLVNEDKNINKLYKYLGFKNSKIYLIMIKKIISLLVLSIITSIIISIIIKIIFI